MATDRMYDLAFQFRGQNLWHQLLDTELYAVQLSDGEIGYCSLAGAVADRPALSVYVGRSGYAVCRNMLACTLNEEPCRGFQYAADDDCLQCTYDNKRALLEEELEEVQEYCRNNGITLRGRFSCPRFLKNLPGCLSWPGFSEQERNRICDALEASLWLCGELKRRGGKKIIGIRDVRNCGGRIPLLVRSGAGWEAGSTELPDMKIVWPRPILENEVLAARIKIMNRSKVWEFGSFYIPSPVLEGNDDGEVLSENTVPFFPYMLLGVERESGMICGSVTGKATEPEMMLRQLAEGMVLDRKAPGKILVQDDRTQALLGDFCNKTHIRMVRVSRIPAFEEAKESLLRHIGNEPEDNEPEELPFDDSQKEELDQFFDTLLKMRDEELKQIPADMRRIIRNMDEMGIVPDELMARLRKLFH